MAAGLGFALHASSPSRRPRLVNQHDRNAIPDGIGEARFSAHQFLAFAIQGERPLGQRTDQDFEKPGIDLGPAHRYGLSQTSRLKSISAPLFSNSTGHTDCVLSHVHGCSTRRLGLAATSKGDGVPRQVRFGSPHPSRSGCLVDNRSRQSPSHIGRRPRLSMSKPARNDPERTVIADRRILGTICVPCSVEATVADSARLVADREDFVHDRPRSRPHQHQHQQSRALP